MFHLARIRPLLLLIARFITVFILHAAITCPSLPLPDNGVIAYMAHSPPPYEFGTAARYLCNTGYGLSTNQPLTCGGDGSSPTGMWNGEIPTCEGSKLYILQSFLT